MLYGDDVAALDFQGNVLEGELPPKAMDMVKEWIELHKAELEKIWETQEFIKIEPLR